MMNVRGLALLVLGIHLLTFGAHTCHAADGWFGSDSTASNKAASSKATSATKTGGMSSWLPWSSSKPKAAKSKKPSMVSNMTRSTKSAWNKTVGFLNPFDNPPKAKASSPIDTRSGDWFSSGSEEKRATSVPEWLGGERPKF
jgi:hypothetical protein